jgi:tRNA(Ile2) C34 agmatinyltransferase TiaS
LTPTCPFCSKPTEDLGLALYYCRECEKYFRPDRITTVMEEVKLRDKPLRW